MEKAPELLPEPKHGDPSEQLPTKKVYQPPKLTKYGTLTEMTRAILLGMGNKDNITGVTKTG